MIEKETLLTLPKGFEESEQQFRRWFEHVKDKVHGNPKTIKAALFYIIAMIYQKKITMLTAGLTFGVTKDSVCRKIPEVIGVIKQEKLIDL